MEEVGRGDDIVRELEEKEESREGDVDTGNVQADVQVSKYVFCLLFFILKFYQ
jgi:hypothetical protein